MGPETVNGALPRPTAGVVIESLIDSAVVLHRQIRDLKNTIERQGQTISCVAAALDGEAPPSFGDIHQVVHRVHALIDRYDRLLDALKTIEADDTMDAKTRGVIRNLITQETSG